MMLPIAAKEQFISAAFTWNMEARFYLAASGHINYFLLCLCLDCYDYFFFLIVFYACGNMQISWPDY